MFGLGPNLSFVALPSCAYCVGNEEERQEQQPPAPEPEPEPRPVGGAVARILAAVRQLRDELPVVGRRRRG